MEQEDLQKEMQSGCLDDQKSKKQAEKPLELSPPKEFICRNSVHTDLWEVTYHRPIYNLGLSVTILLYLSTAFSYYLDSDSLMSHLSVIAWTYGKFHICHSIWVAMMGSILLMLYPTFRFWATSRHLSPKVGLYDLLFLTMFIAFQFALLILPAKIVIKYDVPFMASVCILKEQVRLMMKCHSFVRENAEKVLKHKLHQDGDKRNDIKFSSDLGKLLYFLFAPTLLYRDSYPRTPSIRWKAVKIYCVQASGCFVVCLILFLVFILDNFKNIGKEPLPLEIMVRAFKTLTFASGFFMVYATYGFLHCWSNAFAEILTFGDRRFYQEWWKSVTLAQFSRNWNMIVHEWLHTYVYRETYFHLCKNRFFALMVTFFVSGLLHDYVLGFSLRFGFPLNSIVLTMIIGPLMHITRKRTAIGWNIFVWTFMLSNWVLFISFYCIEWYARKNCPIVLDPFLDIFIPRFLTCN